VNQKENKIVDFNKKKEEKDISEIQYLTFKISNEYYGIKLVENKEVIEPPAITKVPNTKKYVMGVINLRGQIVPVINLENKLDLSSENNKGQKAIVVEVNNTLVGIMVDEVEDVVGIDKKNIEKKKESKGGINQEFINGIFSYQDNLVIIINIRDVLFGDKEIKEANYAQ